MLCEAQAVEELPEVMLGAVKLQYLDLAAISQMRTKYDT